MTRYVFQAPVASSGAVFKVYSDSGATTPAVIYPRHSAIAILGSTVVVGNGFALPLTFLGSDGVQTLYARQLDALSDPFGSTSTLTGVDPTTVNIASAVSAAAYGLAVGRGTANVPIGLHTHVAADTQSNGTDYSVTNTTFHPLTDPNADAIVLVYNNEGVSTAGGAVDFDAPNPITIAAAVITSDGAVVPVTFNGQQQATIPAVGGQFVMADYPVSFGAQVTTTDKFGVTTSPGVWVRTYVSLAQSRVDTVGTTSGSPVVTDTSLLSGDFGRAVSGTGIPAVAYIGPSSIAATSIRLSSSPWTQVDVNATVTNASASLTVKSIFPCNLNNYANGEATTTGAGGANLTLPGSGAVSGGATSAYYGPALILGRTLLRKPIVAIISNSILDGYSDDFHSAYYGPIQRACDQLHYPMVKLSRGGETAASFAAPLSRRMRALLLDGCTHAIVELGTNDGITSTGQATTIAGRLTAIGQFLVQLGIKPYLATVPPRGTSTDGGTSDAGFTATSNIPALAQLNQQIRAGLSPFLGVLDMAALTMTTQDSGIWIRGANSRRVTDLNVTSGAAVVTSATANFTSTDVNTSLMMTTAYPNGVNIDSVTNATTAVVHSNAGSTQTGVVGGIGAFFGSGDFVHPSDAIMRGTLTTASVALMSTWSVS